jgi:hypothetical protein
MKNLESNHIAEVVLHGRSMKEVESLQLLDGAGRSVTVSNLGVAYHRAPCGSSSAESSLGFARKSLFNPFSHGVGHIGHALL